MQMLVPSTSLDLWRVGFAALATLTFLGIAPAISSAAELPQGRAFELVSNEKSNLGDVVQMASSDDGSTVEYMTNAGLESNRSAFYYPVSMAERSSAGWNTGSLEVVPPAVSVGILRSGQLVAVSADMKKAIVDTFTAYDRADQNSGPDMYLLDKETGTATWISKPAELPSTTSGFYFFAGASRDLSRIYFWANGEQPLIPGMPNFSLYEWHEGTVELVSREVDGTPALQSAVAIQPHNVSPYQYPEENRTPAPHGGAHGVSDDGSTLFMQLTTRKGSGLFARRNGETIGVSVSQKSGSEGMASPATFIGASHDGDLAYFLSNEELTDTATAGGGLYSFRPSTDELKLLTPNAGAPSGLGVSSAIMSDDASHVYFIATAALAAEAVEGEPNLYVYNGGATRFIETVPAGTRLERSSRSGRYVLLESAGSIGGANNAGHTEIYRYDDGTGDIVCASCRPDGSASEGDASVQERLEFAFFPPSSAPRNIDDQGDVFFASSDKIVPQDVTAAWDVYEYTEGAPQLLTTGRSQYDSYVADNSDDGTSAFVITRSALLPSDQDGGLRDLYDARVGGGFPETAVEAPACSEDACQGQIPASPRAVATGSSALQSKWRSLHRNRLTAIKTRLGKQSAVLIARVTGPGTLTVGGPGLGSQSRRIKQGGTYRLQVFLKPWARNALKRKAHLTARVTVTFKPTGGGVNRRHIELRFGK